MAVTVLGPAGAPMRPPYGSFAGKPQPSVVTIYTVMGPAGSPMRPPYANALFGTKTASNANVTDYILRARRRSRR